MTEKKKKVICESFRMYLSLNRTPTSFGSRILFDWSFCRIQNDRCFRVFSILIENNVRTPSNKDAMSRGSKHSQNQLFFLFAEKQTNDDETAKALVGTAHVQAGRGRSW
jgi:hypothetical protein